MLRAAASIWDTKIQAVCSVIIACDGEGVEIWLCANFGEASFDPPRVIINQSRLYPIEDAIRVEKHFSLNVLPSSARSAALRLIRARRREPNKGRVMGLSTPLDLRHNIPHLEGALQTLFCEVEEIIPGTGDHTVMIARVLEARDNVALSGERPLLYPEITGAPTRYPQVVRAIRVALTVTGAADLLRRVLIKRRPPADVDLPATTYRNGGQTEDEIEEVRRHGVRDLGRSLVPPER